MKIGPVLLAAGLALIALPSAAQRVPDTLAPLPRSITARSLEQFGSEAALQRYLAQVRKEAKKRGQWWAHRGGPVLLAQNQDVPCPDPENCPETATDAQNIVVTGARVGKPVSITNNQEVGVDEGDIVKQIGDYLLVLQDGRIFVVDLKAKGGMALVSRTNVYRDPDADTWYDEMLVEDDHIIVTGYSYGEDASEVSVFRLLPGGALEPQGVFLISSDDYYDIENYATRLVGDSLVIYTPFDLDNVTTRPIEWPVVRRWLPEDDREEAKAAGKKLFDARAIYRPLQDTLEPIVHTVSVCPIGPVRPGRDMRCRSTAIVGPQQREFYVTPTDVFLWITPGWNEYSPFDAPGDACDDWDRRARSDGHPALLFRVPIDGAPPEALFATGVPIDQFSFDARDGRMRALLAWAPIRCDKTPRDETRVADLRLLDIRLDRLSDRPIHAPASAYTALPPVGSNTIENRFTDDYLVYGSRPRWGLWSLNDKDVVPIESDAAAVPLAAPAKAQRLHVPHGVIRLERIGNDVVMDGYRDSKGLSISILDLSGAAPRLMPPVLLPDRYESEGRSHAFNSAIEADGHGLFGLPTVAKGDDDTWWWRSESSDVSFLSLGRDRVASALGELLAVPPALASAGDEGAGSERLEVDETYECEVSCIDWYGNTRPIFSGGRIFALSGAQLVEGRLDGKRIVEIGRVNLSAPVGDTSKK